MKRERDEKLAKSMEDDAADESLWQDDPAPATAEKSRLGTQVSLRLDPDVAEILRRIASQKRVGYTSLIREWIVERLRAEDHAAERVLLPQASWSSTVSTGQPYSLTGSVRNVSWEPPGQLKKAV
ncbi:MAG: BrnA antitoxin family protein [Candidatus Dormibacteraeota bacterium]|nr:BrnA antitoxin family protein [Candidatus Dormibacteraeota bacterium]MDQ6871975.1 BrnA antitoxin family protein [Gemmatimonadota bacterium]